jgi:hypothetical protein
MSIPQTIALIGAPSQTALLDERIRQTFDRQPLLMGFTFERDLSSAHVELAQCADRDWSELVYADLYCSTDGGARRTLASLDSAWQRLDELLEKAFVTKRAAPSRRRK